VKQLLENWRKFLAEAEATSLPSAGKYKVTMPLKDIYKIFMSTVESNLSALQAVADDPQRLASELERIFEPEELNLKFEVSKPRFNELGDGAFLHGEVSDPTKVEEGELPTVTMILSKYTGEAIKNWDESMDVSGKGYISARTTTGKELMAYTVRGTVVHEFIHQAQSQDPEIKMGGGDDELFARLGELVGVDPESKDFGRHMAKFIEHQVSPEFLNSKKSDKDKEIRDIVNKVYYSNEDEFTGWAQGIPSDLIDMATRGKLPGLENLEGEELRQGILKIIDELIEKAEQGPPDELARESSGLMFYGHPEGFRATYGTPGYKAFLQLGRGYAEKYSENMYK